jgi:flagellar biosynthesis/type III secretory pathway M-ring protein FliF/YscJ
MVGGGVAGAILLLSLGYGFVRRKRKKKAPPAPAVAVPTALSEGSPASEVTAVATQNQLENQMESKLAEREALQAKLDAQALSALKLAPVITKKAEVFAKHLRDKIAKEPELSVQILRGWIREEEN